MSRWVLWVLLALMLAALPAAAQGTVFEGADLVPADFAGLIRLRTDVPAQSLNDLNLLLALAGELQPVRVRLTEAPTFDDYIPFDTLFDVEGVSFATSVLPWLDGELVLAYRQFDAALQTTPDDVLLILPTRDVFLAASSLRPIIEGQDLLERETYRGMTLYIGDKTALAITPSAVLVGAAGLIRRALDVQAGESDSLTASLLYRSVLAAGPVEPPLFAYVRGDFLPQAVAGIISGDTRTQPLFTALGAAMRGLRGATGYDTLLLEGGFDAAGVSLELVPEQSRVETTAIFHAAGVLDTPAGGSGLALLDYVPRTALLVQRGSSLKELGYTLLATLPLSNFSGPMLGGLPFATAGGSSSLIEAPTADDLEQAAISFFDSLQAAAGFDMQAGLLDHLTGDYVLALLPRPNDPLPGLRLPFDVLLVTPAGQDEADIIMENATRLLQIAFAIQPLPASAGENTSVIRLGSGADTLFEIGVVDGVLVVGTGGAAEQALDAQRGDNRLTEQPAWQALSEPDAPGLYLDAAVFFNTFFPTAGGSVSGLNDRVRLGVWNARPERHVFELKVVATLPSSR